MIFEALIKHKIRYYIPEMKADFSKFLLAIVLQRKQNFTVNDVKVTKFGDEKILFQHENAPAHTSYNDHNQDYWIALQKHFLYSLCSLDLAHCDFFLFGNIKRWIDGNTPNEEVIDETYNLWFCIAQDIIFLEKEKSWTKFYQKLNRIKKKIFHVKT